MSNPSPRRLARTPVLVLALVVALVALAACEAGAPPATPPVMPGASAAPRDVNLIAKDYAFLPDVLDLVPGETVALHVINGGLETHEAIIGGPAVQAAWAAAEAAVSGAPPGPTPLVSVSPDVAGVRVVVRSGERVDLVWTVPADPATGAPADTGDAGGWIVACHIPGHLAKGMSIPVRWVDPRAAP